MPLSLNCIYVAASARDARYTRICIASIRYFYPDVPIKLLIGGPLELGLAEELATYWNVGLADFPRGDWGWGFVKLEPLFAPAGERFMMLDSDTVLSGDVLKLWEFSTSDFLIDEDEPRTEDDIHRLYYNWQKLANFDPEACPPKFFFNTGQWFGTSGILTRQDFALLLDWGSMPPTLRHAHCFMPGDQGILNYVLNQKVALGSITVERRKLMHWPGYGMTGLSTEAISSRQAPPLVIHWAGMKKATLEAMVGSDVLNFFEEQYYQAIPSGFGKRLLGRVKYPLAAYQEVATTKVRQKFLSQRS
jgi:hypothetical protein